MADAATGNCIHHWVLGAPESDVVHGRCKRCGLQRDFPASVEGASRQGVYEEAAALSKNVELLPDTGPEKGLALSDRVW